MPNDNLSLAELGKERFPDLTNAERIFLDKMEAGIPADFQTGDKAKDDPTNAASWGADRVLRAEIINWLCLNKTARDLVTDRGIRIFGARIDGNIGLSYVKFGRPLWLDHCAILGSFYCQNAQFAALSLEGSVIVNLNANGMQVAGDVFLRGNFEAKGEVNLLGASISGVLVCTGGTFRNTNGHALSGDRIQVTGGVFLQAGFQAEGEVRLLGASIGSDLDCTGGTFRNTNGQALNADGIQVSGSIFLCDDFNAEGEVRLLGASIGRSLDCTGGLFRNINGYSLNTDGIQVSGSFLLRQDCLLEGVVSMFHAKALDFQYWGLKAPESALLDLREARFGSIGFDTKSLPHRDKLWLHGMTYDSFHDAVPTDAAWWINFIERQTTESPDSLRLATEAGQLKALNASKEARRRLKQAESSRRPLPQPYEQAAKVLRAHGHAEEANAILIAKEDARSRAMSKPSFRWTWHLLSGLLIGYGYRPRRAFFVAVAFVLFGWGVFCVGNHFELMRPVRVDGPAFVPFIYALETFTPLIKLKQADYWFPAMDTTWGVWLARYGYFHTVAGWVLTTLLVAALTGLMRRP
jgi:hypothetical protein